MIKLFHGADISLSQKQKSIFYLLFDVLEDGQLLLYFRVILVDLVKSVLFRIIFDETIIT